MKKIKIGIIILLSGWFLIWGIPSCKSAVKTMSNYKEDFVRAKKVQSEKSSLAQDIKSLDEQIIQLRGDSVDLKDKMAVTDAISEITPITIIEAKRLNGAGDSVTVASVEDKSQVVNFNNEVNEIQYVITTKNYKDTLNKLEKLKLNYESVSIIPEKHQLCLNVLFVGGDTVD